MSSYQPVSGGKMRRTRWIDSVPLAPKLADGEVVCPVCAQPAVPVPVDADPDNARLGPAYAHADRFFLCRWLAWTDATAGLIGALK